MDRRRFLLYSSLAAAPLIGACREGTGLRVSYHPWIGYETLYLARELGWLPPLVELTRRDSASESLAALREDRADAAALTLDEVVRARVQGPDLAVVLVFNASAGADVVVARPSVGSLAGLAGRRIGVETSAVGAVMLDRCLMAAGLERSEVTVVDLPVDRQLSAWEESRIDAVVTYEPTASRLLQSGGDRLIDSRSFPDTIFDVLAVRRDRLDGARTALQALVDAHFRALEHLRVNRQDAIYRISEVEGIDTEAVRTSLGGILLPDRATNRRYLRSDGRLAEVAAEFARQFGGESGAGEGGWLTDAFVRAEGRDAA